MGDEYASLSALVLMERIRAAAAPATLVRDGQLVGEGVPCVCEMGVYSWVLATASGMDGSDVIL